MESCSKENIFKRYYNPYYVFTKPDYFFDDQLDNFDLQEIYDNARLLYNKSPKKENRQPNGINTNGYTNSIKVAEKSKRGSYNFNNKNPAATNSSFITRSDMVKVPVKKKKSLEEAKLVWTLPQ